MSGRIFISYRRDSSAAAAGRLFDHLGEHFDRGNLFMDVDGIEPGVDFVKTVDEQVAQCGAFIAVIGQRWTDLTDADGERRLNDPRDYVRLEIEAALRRDIRVIPVLVDGARMPKAKDLPESLKPLVRRNAFEVAHHRFAADADQLALALQRALGLAPSVSVTSPARDESGPARISWPELLFSFQGRVSRKTYWLSALFMGLVVMCLYGALMLALGDAAFDKGKGPMEPSRQLKTIYFIATLPFYWPIYALSLKRLHDIGHGLTFLLPTLALGIAQVGLDLAGYEQAALNVLLVLGAGWSVLGCIKGAVGPNEFGPDPLAGKRKAGVTPA